MGFFTWEEIIPIISFNFWQGNNCNCWTGNPSATSFRYSTNNNHKCTRSLVLINYQLFINSNHILGKLKKTRLVTTCILPLNKIYMLFMNLLNYMTKIQTGTISEMEYQSTWLTRSNFSTIQTWHRVGNHAYPKYPVTTSSMWKCPSLEIVFL